MTGLIEVEAAPSTGCQREQSATDRRASQRRRCTGCGISKLPCEYPPGRWPGTCLACLEAPPPTRACRTCKKERPIGLFNRRGSVCRRCRETPPPSTKARRRRKCFRCGVEKEPERFPWGDGKKGKGVYRRRRSICAVCVKRDEEAHAARKAELAAQRVTWEQDGRFLRRCCSCHVIKDLETEFYNTRRLPGKPITKTRSWQCKRCCNIKTREYDRAQRADPERLARLRAKQARHRRKWRKENPEEAKAADAAYRERMRRDPVRMAARRALARQAYAEKMEREGHPICRTLRPPELTPDQGPAIDDQRLPALPLHRLVQRELARSESTVAALERIGVSDDEYRGWARRETATVPFDTADRVLTSLYLGWWEVWTDGEAFLLAQELFEGVTADEDAA